MFSLLLRDPSVHVNPYAAKPLEAVSKPFDDSILAIFVKSS